MKESLRKLCDEELLHKAKFEASIYSGRALIKDEVFQC